MKFDTTVIQRLEHFRGLIERYREGMHASPQESKQLAEEIYATYGELEDVFDELLGDMKVPVPNFHSKTPTLYKNFIEAGYLSGRTFHTHQGYTQLLKVMGKVRTLSQSSTCNQGSHPMQEIDVFISHSSNDADMASALIELIRSALSLDASRIRCTTVDGYRLPTGASTDHSLRIEIHGSKAFIALITPVSIESTYVLFELGARWGAEKPLLPLIARGATSKELKGPLGAINALSCDELPQMHQFIEDLSQVLSITPQKPAVYTRHIDKVLEESSKKVILNNNVIPDELVLRGDCYLSKDGDGPFCTTCWDSDNKRIRLKEEMTDFQMITGHKWTCPKCKTRHKGYE